MTTPRDTECPKCRSAMEPGFLIDHSHGGVARPLWARGPLETSWWEGVKTRDRQKLVVVTYRCTRCGFLESYAREGA